MSLLSQEVHFTQNPALGAALLWRFSVGFNESHPVRGFAPLPLLFVVLPTILHQETAEQIARNVEAIRPERICREVQRFHYLEAGPAIRTPYAS